MRTCYVGTIDMKRSRVDFLNAINTVKAFGTTFLEEITLSGWSDGALQRSNDVALLRAFATTPAVGGLQCRFIWDGSAKKEKKKNAMKAGNENRHVPTRYGNQRKTKKKKRKAQVLGSF